MKKRLLSLLLALICMASGTLASFAAEADETEAQSPGVYRKYLTDLDFGNLTMEDLEKDKHITIKENASKVDIYGYENVDPESKIGKVLAFDYDGVNETYTCMPRFTYMFDEIVRSGKLVIEYNFFTTYMRDSQFSFYADASSIVLSTVYSDRGVNVIKGTVTREERPPFVLQANKWVTMQTVFDFDNRVFSIYVDNETVLENEPMTDAIQQIAGIAQTQYPNSTYGVETHTYFKSIKAYTESAVDNSVKEETTENIYKDSETMLKGLGIIGEYDSYSYDTPVTRGRFAQLLTRSMGLADEELESYVNDAFKDVGPENAYKRSIGYLHTLGWIHSSDGKFYPDKNITLAEAAKWMCYLSGYDVIAEKKGGWPYGYISVMSELRVLKNLNLSEDSVLTEGEAFEIFSRLLNVDMAMPVSYGDNVTYDIVDGHTPLTEYFNGCQVEGVVTATSKTGLATSRGAVSENQVQIDSVTYSAATTIPDDLIGKRVIAYVTDNVSGRDKAVVSIVEDTGRNKELVILDEDILGVTEASGNYVLQYENENGKSRKVNLPKTAFYHYNGVAYSDVMPKDKLKPVVGEIRLLDNNADSKYDAIFVNEYTYVAVKSVDAISENIYGQNAEKIHLTEDSRLWNGEKEVALGSLSEWTVLQIAKNMYNDYDILVLKDKVTGMVETLASSEVEIEGANYKISPFLSEPDKAGLIIGGVVTAYLDSHGRICIVEADEKGTSKVGYVIAIGHEGASLNSKIYVKLLDESGKINTYATGKNFLYNGRRLSKISSVIFPEVDSTTGAVTENLENIDSFSDFEKFKRLLQASGFERQIEARLDENGNATADCLKKIGEGKITNTTVRQMVTFRLGEDNTLKAINTDYFTVNRARDFVGLGDHGERSKFYPRGRLIPHFAVIGEDTVSFMIPPEESPDEDYRLMSWDKELTDIDFELYNMSLAMKPEAIIVYDTYKEKVDQNRADVLIVDRVYKAFDEEGNTINAFDVYENGKKVSYKTKDDIIGAGVKRGDLIQIATGKDNVVVAVDIRANAAVGTGTFILGASQRDKEAEFNYGVLTAVENDSLVICGTNKGTAENPVLGTSYPFQINASTRVYLFDVSSKELTIGTTADIASFTYDINPSARVATRSNITRLEDVFIFFDSQS